jgi:hypothetical protein
MRSSKSEAKDPPTPREDNASDSDDKPTAKKRGRPAGSKNKRKGSPIKKAKTQKGKGKTSTLDVAIQGK